MLRPSDGVEGVKAFVLKVVEEAGPNPCPPIMVGVGIGGTSDKAAYLAKKALLREVDVPNEKPYYAALEKELLDSVNALGIGPAGPTTSYRMDAYSPTLISLGLTGMIGKGKRGPEVVAAMKEYGAVYFAQSVAAVRF